MVQCRNMFRRVGFILATLMSVTAVAGLAQRGGVFRASRDHPAIGYSTGTVENAIVSLNRKIQDGEFQLKFDDGFGYLSSVLAALDISVESQVTVFSPTSNQATLIASDNPRAIYFRDDVSVAWVRGTTSLEAAVQDVHQGTVFYSLPQMPADTPQFTRDDQCLACHLTWDTLGVPGLQVLSTFPLTSDPNAYATGHVSDHRTRLEDRWGGWYVTGNHEPFVHMGNVEVTDVDDPNATIGMPRQPLLSLSGLFDLEGYLSLHSDIVALMVLEHQVHMTNLITRMGWESRRVLYREQGWDARTDHDDSEILIDEVARELVDYLLFVDEAPLAVPIQGSSRFSQTFASRPPRDSQGRSLREFDLEHRLMRYPCSYMIYTEAFDALPALAKDAIYRRMWAVLSGEDIQKPYDRLSDDDRRAVVEILIDTKPDLPGFFQNFTE